MAAALSLSPVAVGLIGLYQRYLSPIKGFRCAHRARGDGRTSSCSQFAKRAFARFGVFLGATLLKRRFAKCAASARALQCETPKDQAKRSHADRTSSCDHLADCDVSGCGDAVGSCHGFPDACGGLDGIGDVAACDCSF